MRGSSRGAACMASVLAESAVTCGSMVDSGGRLRFGVVTGHCSAKGGWSGCSGGKELRREDAMVIEEGRYCGKDSGGTVSSEASLFLFESVEGGSYAE